jgi:L-amino acid N-acyltransferase YncA/predicted RNA-binding protein with PUA-like domain
MKFLLDTNIIIPAEPTAVENIETGTPLITELLGLLSKGKQEIYVHEVSKQELSGDKDKQRWAVRKVLLDKYALLPNPPTITKAIEAAFTTASLNQHDQIDLILLSAVDADAVDYLITNDIKLRKKSALLGLEPRVATPEEAITIVRALFPVTPTPPPAVYSRYAHELDIEEPIFDSFRVDYPEFNEWFRKCKLQHRPVWTISNRTGGIGGVCIIKPNDSSPEYEGIPVPSLKICSFKIDENCRGYRFGELLLKAVFDYAAQNKQASIYITTFDKQVELLNLLENFGFETVSESDRGETVLLKILKFSSIDYQSLAPLEFNIKFGPKQVKFDGANAFLVPIVPKYHRILLPEAEAQLEFLSGEHPFGNGIRKAYLCHANIRKISPGDVVFFYRSGKYSGITTYGVVENVIVSKDPDEIARSVGKRTIYTYPEIENLCSKGTVLVILFRLSFTIAEPISLKELLKEKVIQKAPQSIISLSFESALWLKAQITR